MTVLTALKCVMCISGPTHEPGVRDHPEAAVYNKNFKGKKEELTRRLFKLFNREVFDRRVRKMI